MKTRTSEPSSAPSVGHVFRPPGGMDLSGRPVDLAGGRGPRVLVLPHEDCHRCRDWLTGDLAAREPEVRQWGGRIAALAPETSGGGPGAAWLAVVDEWGEVFHVADIGPEHAFPDVADVAEWTRFVAIQCPECEAAESRWRTL